MKTIGDYILQQRIDTAGVVSRFGGIKRSSNTSVTLHLVSKQHIRDSGIHEKVKHEYELARCIQSPHVIKYLDIVETETVLAIVTEALPAMSLRSYLAIHAEVGLEKAIEIMTKIAIGLNACHRQGVVHRDIRPENIYVDAKGGVKIANFGLSTLSSSSTVTLTGTLFGDPEYTPPENLYAEQKSLKGDIYATGIILYEMLVGNNPFEGCTITEIIQAKSESSLTPPSAIVPNLPAWVDILVLKMTASRPELRPSSFIEVMSSLQNRTHQAVTTLSSGKSCTKCGFSLHYELPFCPYCGSIKDEKSDATGGQVMILKNVKNRQAAEDILDNTFSVDANRSLKKVLGKKIIPVFENTSKDQDPWLDEQLRNTGTSVEYISMDAWYFKLSSLIMFCLIVCPAIFWSMVDGWEMRNEFNLLGFKALRNESFRIPGLMIGFSMLIFAVLFIKSVRRHYAPLWKIPGSFFKGVISSDHVLKSTKPVQRIFVPALVFLSFLFVVAFATFLTCRVVYIATLIFVVHMPIGYLPTLTISYNGPYPFYLLLNLCGLLIIKIFVGTIYLRPLFNKNDRIVQSKESRELQNTSIYAKLEKIRLLLKSIANQTFRYAMADLLAYYISFAALLKQAPDSVDMFFADFKLQMETSIDSALTIGDQIKRIVTNLSDLKYENAKKRLEQLQYELSIKDQGPHQLIKDELRGAQKTIIDHESASEVLIMNLNALNQIVGGVKALTLQLSELVTDNSCNLNTVKMNLAMLSENLISLNITKPTTYESL